MTKKIKVSCIIPVYNEAVRMSGPIEAALHCPLVDEVIVVNDASTDDTKQQLEKYPTLKAINLPENHGIAYALETGARASSGDILVFLDSDLMHIGPEHVQALLQPVLDHPEIVTMSMRQNSLFLYRWVGIDFITGEKAIAKKLFLSLPEVSNSRYGFVLHLNELLLKKKVPVVSILLQGVLHPQKVEKKGLIRGWMGEIRMIYEMSKVMSIPAMAIQCLRMAKISKETKKKYNLN